MGLAGKCARMGRPSSRRRPGRAGLAGRCLRRL